MTDYASIYESDAARYQRLVAREDYEGNILPALAAVRPLERIDVVELGAEGEGAARELAADRLHTGADRREIRDLQYPARRQHLGVREAPLDVDLGEAPIVVQRHAELLCARVERLAEAPAGAGRRARTRRRAPFARVDACARGRLLTLHGLAR